MNLSQNSDQRARPSAAAERRRNRRDSGYAYIMALFMVLTVIIGSQVVLRNMVTARRSQREAEMIWRGNQYDRAIKLYYRKTGHFPQSQDDLVTGVPDMHFLRSEAMKDPMNTQDGAWRFIYMNATGVIIGSVKYGTLQQMAMMDMNGGQMPGTQQPTAQTGTGTSATSATTNSNSTGGGFSLPSMGVTPTAGVGPAALGPPGQAVTGAGATIVGPQPTGPVTGQVFGGQLIGVGSTVDRTSVRVYKGGTKYNEWEFIYNPIEEQARAIQQGLGPAAPGVTGIPGLALPIAPIGGGAPGGASNPTPGSSGNSSGGANPSSGTNNTSPSTQ